MKYTVPGYTSWCLTVELVRSLNLFILGHYQNNFILKKYPHDYLAKAVGIDTLDWQLHISRAEKNLRV